MPTANLLTRGIDEVFTRTTVAPDPKGARNFLSDALGSTIALTDSAKSFRTTYTYEPFGNTASFSGATSNSYQYTERENDGTGLYFYRARYYSPTLQRFIAEGPIGVNGGINRYGYTENDPIDLRDPLGLESGTTYKIDYDNLKGHCRRRRLRAGIALLNRQSRPSQRNLPRSHALLSLMIPNWLVWIRSLTRTFASHTRWN